MIALFDRRRAALLALLLLVALVQLTASIAIAALLHRLGDPRMLSIACAAAVLAFGLEVLQRNLSERIGLSYTAALRDRLYRQLLAADPAVVHARRHGAMLQSFVGDLTALRQWVSEGIMRAALAALALAGLFGWLALAFPAMMPVLAAVTAATLLLGAVLIVPLHRTVRRVRRERGRVSALASDRLAASATVLASGRIGSEAARLGRRVDRLNAAWMHRAWFSATLRALPHLAVTAMLVAAVAVRMHGQSGSLAGLVLVIGLIGHALRDLARAAELAVPGRVSHRRLTGLLAIEPLPAVAPQPRQAGEAGALVFDHIVLRDRTSAVAERFESGQRVEVDGDPALVDILFRIIGGTARPRSGALRWDGMVLDGYRPSRRRKLVGWVSPDLPLLHGPDHFNLRYRSPGTGGADSERLLKHWRSSLSDSIPDRGKLMVLRALAGSPPVLLLDQADRALDQTDRVRLAETVRSWPGVVLMAAGQSQLHETATHRLSLHRERNELLALEPARPLRLVGKQEEAQ